MIFRLVLDKMKRDKIFRFVRFSLQLLDYDQIIRYYVTFDFN